MEIESGTGTEHVPLASSVRAPSAQVPSSGRAPNGLISNTNARIRKGLKTLSRMKIPFKAPSLIDRTQPYFSGIARFGITGFLDLINDPFHTMLNMTWGRFIALFFAMFFTEYLVFALLFYVQGDKCVYGMDGKFSHALWMSSRTASTLGFNEISPNPDCGFINFTVMIEVVSSSLVNFIMLGVVFARFSAPFKRSSSVRFSKNAVVHSHPSGYWAVSMRVANLRKHQILQPSIRLVITAIDSITPSNYMFEHLKIEQIYAQETNLELGFPANLVHVIGPDSFLYNLSLLEMDTRMMELLVFVDGIDAMTSKHMSAKFSYSTNDILLNQVHVPLNLEMRGKKLGLDFNEFDRTMPASMALEDELNQRKLAGADPTASANVAAAAAGAEATSAFGWQLRHQTFRRLAERYGTLTAAGAVRAQEQDQGGSGDVPSTGSPNSAKSMSEGGGVFAGTYLRYKRDTARQASMAETHPQQQQQQQQHVALYVAPPGGDAAAAASMAAGGVGGGNGHHALAAAGGSGGYAPLMLNSPDAHREGGHASSSAPGGGALAYQPPVSVPLVVVPGGRHGSEGNAAGGSIGGGHAAATPGVAVVSPELAAAAPHLWDPSVSGLAPYAQFAAAQTAAPPRSGSPSAAAFPPLPPLPPPPGSSSSGGGAALWGGASAAAASKLLGTASVGGLQERGSGGSAGDGLAPRQHSMDLPVSSGANEPAHHTDSPFTIL